MLLSAFLGILLYTQNGLGLILNIRDRPKPIFCLNAKLI